MRRRLGAAIGAAAALVLAALGSTASVLAEPQRPATAGEVHATAVAPVTAAAPALDLAEAVSLAMTHDPAAAAARAGSAAAAAGSELAGLRRMPDVLLGVGMTAGFPGSGSNLGLRGMLSSPFFRNVVAGVDVKFDILDPLRARPEATLAQAEATVARAQLALARRALTLQLIDAYAVVLASEREARDVEAERDLRARLARAIDAKVQTGRAPSITAHIARAAVAEAGARRAAALARAATARRLLVALTEDARFATWRVELSAAPPANRAPERELAAARRSQSHALRQLEASASWPRLVVAASLGYAHAAAPTQTGWYAGGASIALPLTANARERAVRRRDVARSDAAIADADGAKRALAIAIEGLRGQLAAVDATLPASEESLRASEAALRALEAEVSAGRVALDDAHAAMLTWSVAVSQHARLAIERAVLVARLRVLAGE